ncbi:MAG: ABC transporter permease [Corynebacterium sp.]|uniref:ABC transporter permease n=1 Tax=Corynebacterium sp. TaxID=1720 RepID=UPI0026DD36F6|nr:ABC transporter permease [Corynebacterium sp.]MDO4762526.1 ABC transporter permease [Corynebacterium sp.]
MIRHLDFGVVATIARREAFLSLRSLGTHLTLVVLAAGMIYLARGVLEPREDLFAGEVGITIVSIFLFVALSIVIMMNSTLAGASITDERDNKITEILLSAARPEELYIGKLFGHALVGIGQLIVLWAVVVLSLFSIDTGAKSHFPWVTAVVILAFFLPGYLLFTALHAIIGVLVSRNEDYVFAQIPILFLLLFSLSIPFAPLVNWGSSSEGWLVAISWVPPLSMGAAPLVHLVGNGAVWLVVSSWLLLVFSTLILLVLGGKIFHRRILV